MARETSEGEPPPESGDRLASRHGVPLGERSRLHRRRFVAAEAAVATFAGAGKLDATRFRQDLDALVDQDPAPRV